MSHAVAVHFLEKSLSRLEATVAQLKADGSAEESEELVTMKDAAASIKNSIEFLKEIDAVTAKAAEIRSRAKGGPSTS